MAKIDNSKKLNPEKNKFIKTDSKGHYDIDGVSFVGDEVNVSGDNTRQSETLNNRDSINIKSKGVDFKRNSNQVTAGCE